MSHEAPPPAPAHASRGWAGFVAGLVAVGLAVLFTFTGQRPDYFSQVLMVSGLALMSGTHVYLFVQSSRLLKIAGNVQKAMKEKSDE